MDEPIIQGFSKLTKQQRIKVLIKKYNFDQETGNWLKRFETTDESNLKIIEELSENPISTFHLPFSIAPNFVVNGKNLFFPLVSEESSVVAALAKTAGFWALHGGFHAEVVGTEKRGQVHFRQAGSFEKLTKHFPEIKSKLLAESEWLTTKMKSRGGGITRLELKSLPHIFPDYYQIDAGFETCDAMGANFINSCLEQFAKSLQDYFSTNQAFQSEERNCEIILSILSNYTPESRVRAWVECKITDLSEGQTHEESELFAQKFEQAIRISKLDVSRAVTHNKGIFNGVDALAIATGNDFRAIEACGHAYACRNGSYAGLTDVQLHDGIFHFSIELALAVGTVGGVTSLHPMTKLAMSILDHPSANELMMYMAVTGLASNFAAIKALVSSGIQKGHMKMHLNNILNQLKVPDNQRMAVLQYFHDKTVSYSLVEEFLKRK